MATWMVYLGLWKGLSEEGSLSWTLNSDRVGISGTGAQITFQNFQKLLAHGLEGVWCLICAEQSWGVRGECAVEMTVCKICHLVLTAEFYRQPMQLVWQWCYVMSLTSLWNTLCCTVLNPLRSTSLFCRQIGQDRVAEIKAGYQGEHILQKCFLRDMVWWTCDC